MTTLENPKHEVFAQLVALGKTQVSAYVEAGYSPSGARASSSRLLTNANISRRIEELQLAQLENNNANLNQMVVEINGLIKQASNFGQYHAAIKGMALKLRVLGYI